MKSQQRTGGQRAIETSIKRARIYARYEIGQSLYHFSKVTRDLVKRQKARGKRQKAKLARYLEINFNKK
jgi:hypothetical protein